MAGVNWSLVSLVSPSRVLHYVDSEQSRGEPALRELAIQYELDADGVKNLRQLLGWVGVGKGRKTRINVHFNTLGRDTQLACALAARKQVDNILGEHVLLAAEEQVRLAGC